MDNNNINNYNLQNRIKWRKIYFYKNIKLLGIDVWERLNNVLFNRNDDNDNTYFDLSGLFVSYLYF